MSTPTSFPVAQPIGAQKWPAMRVRGLTKRYGQAVALDDVSLDVQFGEVHVLFGENGAGKSTLISLISGARQPSSGSIAIEGHVCRLDSVATARAHGVRAVFQELSLVPQLTVAENIMLGEEPTNGLGLLSKSKVLREAKRLVDELGFDLDVDAKISTLARGKQQMVEICKALRQNLKLLILDEPTASLSEHDAQSFFALIRRLRSHGTAVIYVTHRMHEISLLGDRVSILRDGRHVKTVRGGTSSDELIRLMSGREVAALYPEPGPDVGPVQLAIENVTLAQETGVVQVIDATIKIRAGEIVGLAGLVGSGKSELAQACFGLKKFEQGRILIEGAPVAIRSPSDAIRQRLWYTPADRKNDGLMLERSSRENLALSSLAMGALQGAWIRPRRELDYLSNVVSAVDFSIGRLKDPISVLSGGNQQKVLLAKSLVQDVKAFVLDEPTVGVDIGACMSIYRYLSELSARGAAILLVSSNLPELIGLTHRMMVMCDGRLVAEFKREDYDEYRILQTFF